MRSRYFTFLYNECKRSSTLPVNSEEIKQFIDSPEGQRGLKAFCARHKIEPKQSRLKTAGEILAEYEHE